MSRQIQKRMYVSEREKPFNTTAKTLGEAAFLDNIPECKQTLKDFGFLKLDRNNQYLLLSIYQNIIQYQGITANIIHNIQVAGKLNEFIKSRFLDEEGSYYTSGGHEGKCVFYPKFIANKITIESSKPDYTFNMLPADTCPTCCRGQLHDCISNNRASHCGICYRTICDSCFTEEEVCKDCHEIVIRSLMKYQILI